jgi:hypothetical protein
MHQTHDMEYYDDHDYLRASPGLTPTRPDPNDYSPLPFAPLWLPQDTCETPLVRLRTFRLTACLK